MHSHWQGIIQKQCSYGIITQRVFLRKSLELKKGHLEKSMFCDQSCMLWCYTLLLVYTPIQTLQPFLQHKKIKALVALVEQGFSSIKNRHILVWNDSWPTKQMHMMISKTNVPSLIKICQPTADLSRYKSHSKNSHKSV